MSPQPRCSDATRSRTVTDPISGSDTGNSSANSAQSRTTSPAINCCVTGSGHRIVSATVRATRSNLLSITGPTLPKCR